MEKRTVRTLAAGAIGAFLLLGFLHLSDYGEILDEQFAQDRGALSIQLAGSVLFRTEKLSDTDLAHLRFLKHPPFFAMVNYGTSKLGRALGLGPIESRHYFILLWSAFGLFLLYRLASETLSATVGFYSIVVMLLFPPFLAHAQFNPKDIPFMVNAIASVYVFNRFLRARTTRGAVWAGVVYGLTVATHLNGLLLIPIFLVGLFALRSEWRGERGFTGRLAIAGGGAMVALFAAWPLLWVDPLSALRTAREFTGHFMDVGVLYFGREYAASRLPWHYTPVQIFISTPVILIALGIIGAWRALRGFWTPRQRAVIHMLLTWIAVSLGSQMIPGISRYDGMRHAFFAIPALAVLAAIGLDMIPRRRWIQPITLLVLIGIVEAQVAPIHPFEHCYRNEIARWRYSTNFEKEFSPTDWSSAARQGIAWVNAHAPANAVVCYDKPFLIDQLNRPDLILDCNPAADYRMVGSDGVGLGDASKGTPVFSVGPYGTALMSVYDMRSFDADPSPS